MDFGVRFRHLSNTIKTLSCTIYSIYLCTFVPRQVCGLSTKTRTYPTSPHLRPISGDPV